VRGAWLDPRGADSLREFWWSFLRDGFLSPKEITAITHPLAVSLKSATRRKEVVFLLAWLFPSPIVDAGRRGTAATRNVALTAATRNVAQDTRWAISTRPITATPWDVP